MGADHTLISLYHGFHAKRPGQHAHASREIMPSAYLANGAIDFTT